MREPRIPSTLNFIEALDSVDISAAQYARRATAHLQFLHCKLKVMGNFVVSVETKVVSVIQVVRRRFHLRGFTANTFKCSHPIGRTTMGERHGWMMKDVMRDEEKVNEGS